MDGVAFIFKRKPMQDPTVPKGNIWTKRSGGAAINSKGSKDLPGRKMLHFLAAIAFNRGVVLVLHYEHMTGKYFCDFNLRRKIYSCSLPA